MSNLLKQALTQYETKILEEQFADKIFYSEVPYSLQTELIAYFPAPQGDGFVRMGVIYWIDPVKDYRHLQRIECIRWSTSDVLEAIRNEQITLDQFAQEGSPRYQDIKRWYRFYRQIEADINAPRPKNQEEEKES